MWWFYWIQTTTMPRPEPSSSHHMNAECQISWFVLLLKTFFFCFFLPDQVNVVSDLVRIIWKKNEKWNWNSYNFQFARLYFLDDETNARRKFAAAGKVSLWSFLVNSHLVKFKVSVYFSLIKLISRFYRCFMSSDVFGDDYLFYKKKTYNFLFNT